MELINFSTDAITSEEEVRELVGTPHEYVVKKSIPVLDEHCKRFIEMSPLYFLSTSNAEGQCDVSPKGDFPCGIQILNNKQLVIPDRPGNRRVDSIINILSNPHIGLLFLIPGLEEVLRINGRATIIKKPELLNNMSLNGKPPLLGIGVDIEECFIHCSRALKKSKVWNTDSWPNTEDLPSWLDIFHAALEHNGVEVKR
ncbi:pyridoxamine 5'-phosphate oxidase family protein [Bacillus luteolus]|uniref:Pyridoxamine 5'-phosphate oxidase family protein n=1 Tax=Litchfieldia luteola TaxID=682179 RepID=A0ABR9QKY0_9BACI|nr:MSMEG_1061 family FMN-dependent PPOX-type flavoprotein [Cytobacillus luteolus]MBE4909155.1 pyridoxamine 5'-phosphate oxidase family protein [Cytobacillus luteolus]MBP1940393.1 PPOX class probable FMN-dependent enzyme [Cytobacillus luteolus]